MSLTSGTWSWPASPCSSWMAWPQIWHLINRSKRLAVDGQINGRLVNHGLVLDDAKRRKMSDQQLKYHFIKWPVIQLVFLKALLHLLHKFITQTQHKWVNDFLAELLFKFSRNIHFISSIFIPEIIDRHVDSGQHLSIGQHHQSAIGVDISNMSRHISDTAKETENDNIRSVVCYRSHFGRQLLTKWNILKRKE